MTDKKKPFPEELVEKASAAIDALLEEIPELEAAAMVFSYCYTSDALPYAIIKGQSGPITSPAEIVKLTQQTIKALNYELQLSQQCLQNIDKYMGERRKQLEQLEEEVHAAERKRDGLHVSNGD